MQKTTININHQNQELLISANIRKWNDEWIFCMHWLQSNKELFNPLFEIEKLNKYSIIAFDFVWFWESSKPDDFSYKIENQVEICKEIIKSLNIKKLHLIWHSLGWMIWTLLLNDEVLSFTNLEWNLILKDCWTSLEVNKIHFEEFKEIEYPKLVLKLENSTDKTENTRWKWLYSIPDFTFYKTSKSIVEWSKNEILLDLFIKSLQNKLYIYGEKNSFKIKVLPKNINVKKINNSWHFMILENPKETFDSITDFITNN